MAEITASMVKELREKTDAPMMECKKALSETGGDLKQAEELLRIKLGNKASRAASRVAADGLVAARIEGGVGALVEVNSETDFVARNQEFADFVGELAALVVRTGPADLDALRLTRVDGRSVEEMRTALIGRLGENLAIRRFVRYQSTERLASYLHGTRIGVLVDYSADDGQVGKDLAMHIAASRPLCVSRDQIPEHFVERERRISEAQAAQSGKSAEIVAKMVEGRVNRFRAELALLEQPFVRNPDETVAKMLARHNAHVNNFTLFVVGEGIERPAGDFAAEVAAQVAAAQNSR